MKALHNEILPFPAQWTRNLIAAGHLPEGDVDERSIKELVAADLDGRAQAHFFAGIGGFWRDAEWVLCRDGKARPIEPGTFPLVNRASTRVGRLHAYGNAIVAPLAVTFIEAVMDILCE